MQRFQLKIVCRNCRHGAHESCTELQKQDFVTIKCCCICHKKNQSTERIDGSDSVDDICPSWEGSKLNE